MLFSVTGGIDDHGSRAQEHNTAIFCCFISCELWYVLLFYVMWTFLFILVVMWTTLCLFKCIWTSFYLCHVNLSCVCFVFLYHLSGSCLLSIAFTVQYKQRRVHLYHPVLSVSGVVISLLSGSCYIIFLDTTITIYHRLCLVFSLETRNDHEKQQQNHR